MPSASAVHTKVLRAAWVEHFPFRMYFFTAGSRLEVCKFDGFYESAEFGYFLDVVVHFLVGYYRKDKISGISCMGVFGQYRFCPGIERDDEGVVGLLGIDTYLVVLDVGMGQLCHIAVTKAGVCAEAEHVSGAVEAGGEGDGLLYFSPWILMSSTSVPSSGMT